MGAEREREGVIDCVSDHCARAGEFDREAVKVERWLANVSNEEVRETLKVISENWRQLAALHRRLQEQCR
jgi:hypothetical protein